jgi:hypothetical protein
MVSSNDQKKLPEDIAIKKELSAAFIRIGLLTASIGFAGILVGLWLKNQLKAAPLVTVLPLLISLPIVMVINLVIIRRLLIKINPRSKK